MTGSIPCTPEPSTQVGPPPSALLRTLLLREWRGARLLMLLLIGMSVAAVVGWAAASLTASVGAQASVWYAPPSMARQFGSYSAAIFAVLGAFACINRATDDHRAQWLVPLTALSDSRLHYPAFLYLSTVSVLLVAFALIVVAFAVSATIVGESYFRQSVQWLIGGSASIASFSAWGLALGLLCKSRAAAVVIGLMLYTIPYLITLAQVLRTDMLPPAWLHRLLFLYLPPSSQSVATSVLLQHLTYIAALLILLRFASARLVARYQ